VGTFWIEIKQFWPFEEKKIFLVTVAILDGGRGYRT
jgi:hypothetical protein